PRRRKAEVVEELLRQALRRGQGRRLLGTHLLAQALQGQLMGEQLLEGQALLRPVLSLGQLRQVGIRRRPVQIAQGLGQWPESILFSQLRRQPVRQAMRAQARQGLLTELAQTLLGQPFGRRVDGRQALLYRSRLVAALRTVFRVVDFQAGGAGTHFAIAAQGRTALKAILLRLTEMEETQAERAAAILQAYQQAAPP